MERSQRLCKSTAPASFNAARPHSTKMPGARQSPYIDWKAIPRKRLRQRNNKNKDMSLLDCWILGPEKHRMDNIIRSWECFTMCSPNAYMDLS